MRENSIPFLPWTIVIYLGCYLFWIINYVLGCLQDLRDDHFEEDDQIISRETIERSIDEGEAYRIMSDDNPVGGVVIKVDGVKGDLHLLECLGLKRG